MCQYFSHDYNARFDIKLRRLRFDMGLYGLGAYWGIVEELYNCGNVLRVSDIKMVARSLSTTAKKLMRVITDYDLFSIVEDEEGDYICSKSVARRLELRRDASKQRERSDEKSQISEMRRAAANARWKSKMQNGDFAYAKPMQNDAHIKYKEKDKLTTTTSSSSSSTNTREEIVDVDDDEMKPDAPRQEGNEPRCETRGRLVRHDAPKTNVEGEKTASDTEMVQVLAPRQNKPEMTPLNEKSKTEAVEAELRQLMTNDQVRFQLNCKSGGMDEATAASLIPEFAGQLVLQGKEDDEHGMRLALHFGYWLKKKKSILDKEQKYANKRQQSADADRRDLELLYSFMHS